jgi:hypothetical protein
MAAVAPSSSLWCTPKASDERSCLLLLTVQESKAWLLLVDDDSSNNDQNIRRIVIRKEGQGMTASKNPLQVFLISCGKIPTTKEHCWAGAVTKLFLGLNQSVQPHPKAHTMVVSPYLWRQFCHSFPHPFVWNSEWQKALQWWAPAEPSSVDYEGDVA